MLITIDAQTAEELKSKIHELAITFGVVLPAAAGCPADMDAGANAAETAPKKRGPKGKSAAAAAEVPAGAVPTEAPAATVGAPATTSATPVSSPVAAAAPAPLLTVNDLKAALEKLVAAKGVDTAMNALGNFGFKNMSAVPADKLPEVVTYCNHLAAVA